MQIEGEKITSYSDLAKLLRQYARGFYEHGVRAGDRIIIARSKDDAYVFASRRSVKGEMTYHIEDGQASFCLSDNDNLASVIDHQSRFKKIFVTTGESGGFVSVSSFKGLPERALEELGEADTKKTLGAIAYTSGTTGDPKGVMLSQYSFVAAVQAIKCAHHFSAPPTGMIRDRKIRE
ncbi:hypothetical protein HPB48_020043 [Haemaphysalis longicornis]|uniref:AMP-dependent synthetase/ligase domain-containing protein n=1 Tax=Haemaphysalis longicornis TaxID=44386 RepID=A0A9J6GY61_HAELO|nr:hypothetical protein HPB48_020043 [Haemaphysalis longicornis]